MCECGSIHVCPIGDPGFSRPSREPIILRWWCHCLDLAFIQLRRNTLYRRGGACERRTGPSFSPSLSINSLGLIPYLTAKLHLRNRSRYMKSARCKPSPGPLQPGLRCYYLTFALSGVGLAGKHGNLPPRPTFGRWHHLLGAMPSWCNTHRLSVSHTYTFSHFLTFRFTLHLQGCAVLFLN